MQNILILIFIAAVLGYGFIGGGGGAILGIVFGAIAIIALFLIIFLGVMIKLAREPKSKVFGIPTETTEGF